MSRMRKRGSMSICAAFGAVGLAALLASGTLHGSNTLVPPGAARYAPSAFPERIVALPDADPATSFAVAWRTDATLASAVLEIAEVRSSPDLADAARTIRAVSTKLQTENGVAYYHHARISGLKPEALYAYRVQGAGTWSEWFQIRTAAAQPRPFAFLYFGDAQNSVKSLYSRVIREAWRREPRAALAVHAGDLVNGRAGENDTEWGEWFDAGAFLHASLLTVPAAGNHEHHDREVDGRETYQLAAHWPAQFPLPRNGASGLPHTTYSFDYQGVRFIVLDSTSALKSGSAATQAAWLEPLLEHNPHRWTVVVFHHPVFSASLDRDNSHLREHWAPLFERYGVDLVLQGHDHVYARGQGLFAAGTRDRGTKPPVYVVSVAGPKQYRVSEEAQSAMARHGENTQLYQIVRIDDERLRYESWTVAGELYDAFDIEIAPEGAKRFVDRAPSTASRRCPHLQTRSGRTDRCWDGTEW